MKFLRTSVAPAVGAIRAFVEAFFVAGRPGKSARLAWVLSLCVLGEPALAFPAWLHGDSRPLTGSISLRESSRTRWAQPRDVGRLGLRISQLGPPGAGQPPAPPFGLVEVFPQDTRPLVARGEGSGYIISVPAGPAEQVVRLYFTAAQSRVLITGKLTGGGAQFYADTSFAGTEVPDGRCYTFNAAAAKEGETLEIEAKIMHARSGDARLALWAVSLTVPGTNAAPTVRIVNPRDHAYFEAPANVVVQAEASDADGIAKVVFYDRSLAQKLGEVSEPPYRLEIDRRKAWFGSFIARAYDRNGKATDSAPVPYCVIDSSFPREARTPPLRYDYPSAGLPLAGWEAAASLAELPNGDLAAAWYRARYELSADTAIWSATYSAKAQTWSPARRIIHETNVALGNPVLFSHEGVLWCFYVKVFGNSWEFARLYCQRSHDLGRTWEQERPFPQPESRYPTGTMSATRPLVLRNGDILLPLNRESYDPDAEKQWYSLFLISSDRGKSWNETAPLYAKRGNIQPAVEQLDDGSLVAFFRPRGLHGFLWTSHSHDNGRTWDPLAKTDIVNPSARVALGRLANGHLVMAFNDDGERRTPLQVALSTDGGKSWPIRRAIEVGGWAFTYPYVLVTGGDRIHVVYDDNRDGIKHAIINEAWFHEP